MPLIICPDCTHQISDALRSCPHCARQIVPDDVAWNREIEAAGARRTAIGCGLVGLAIILLFAWCDNGTGSISTPSAPAAAQPSAARAKLEMLGQALVAVITHRAAGAPRAYEVTSMYNRRSTPEPYRLHHGSNAPLESRAHVDSKRPGGVT